jgi:hypothetical protein
MTDEDREFGGIKIGRGNKNTRRKICHFFHHKSQMN